MEDVPGCQADVAAHHQREAHAVQHEADGQLRQPRPRRPARSWATGPESARVETRRGQARSHGSSLSADWPSFESPLLIYWTACRILSAPRVATLVGDFPRSPAYAGLADALRELIGDGRIGSTPGCRASATSPTRWGSAARRSPGRTPLRDRGFAEARHGSGTFTRLPGGPTPGAGPGVCPRTSRGLIDLVCAAPSAPPGSPRLTRTPSPSCPRTSRARLLPRRARRAPGRIAASYDARGLATSPDQILVTAGALAATASSPAPCRLAGPGARGVPGLSQRDQGAGPRGGRLVAPRSTRTAGISTYRRRGRDGHLGSST